MQSTSNVPSIVNRESLLDRLNKEQAEAVCLQWGPSLVIAGAGSGKTTVLTRRVAYLLSELKQAPASILAVTFTNKAAGEMRQRLEKLVGAGTGRQLSIGTFHSVCARLLRFEIDSFQSREGHRWKNNFVIYDETDSLSLVKDVVSKLNLDEKMYAPREMRHRISSFKNDGVTAAEYMSEARRYADQKFADIYTGYQAALARNNALDFDDLILTFSQVLEQNEEVRLRLQNRFRHVLVDEFQDTNQAQYKLIRLLSPAENKSAQGEELSGFWHERSLMVVGDVDQSIYSWRQADFRIILGFQSDYPSSSMIKLEENYRSTATILDVANSIIQNNSERIDKVLRCNRGKGGKVRINAGSDEIDEAYFVAEELKRL